jgi:Phasin protein
MLQRSEHALTICAMHLNICAVLVPPAASEAPRNRAPGANVMMKPFEMKPFEDFQKLGQTNVDAAMKAFGEWNKGWQAIAAEMTDYTKRSFEESSATFEKLVSSRSIEQVMEIQTTYAKRAYDEYMHQLTKIGGMYAELAKEAYRPVERAMQNGR